ncbi:MAG TPA: ABC transporter substrate-binding protein [Alphaproteobacteria bacterium]|nr:ABC transporter substrate-binding protein [Alphaproteobacteria bacterium]
MTIARRIAILLLLLGGLAAAMPAGFAAVQPTSPEQAAAFITDIGNRVIKVLANHGLAPAQRDARVKALLDEGLDLAAIGRFALGPAGRTATPEQRSEYDKLFHDYVLTSYARRFSAYSGETFKVTSAQPIAGSDALVLTQVTRPSGEIVNVDWRVRDEDGHMKILDVLIEGVSLVVTQRQEFAAVEQNKGIDGLLQSMRQQIKAFESGAGAPSQ